MEIPSPLAHPTIQNVNIGIAVAEASSVLLWISDTKKKCIYFNQAWLVYRGRTLEQEYGFGWAEGVHPGDYQRCLDIYNTAFDAKQKFSMDYRLKKANGSYGWIQDDGVPYYNKQREFEGYVGSCFDVTESRTLLEALKTKKAELETSNLRLKQSVKAGHIGVWDWNIFESVLVWDEQMYEIYGIPSTEGVKKFDLWKDAIYPEDKEVTIRTLEDAIAGKCDYNLEFRIIRPNGAIRHIKADATIIRDEHGNALRMLGTNLDITERIRTEERVIKLERRNQALLDYSPVCHKIVDLDFNLQYMNRNGFNMLSLPVNDDWYGKPYPFSFFCDESKRILEQWLKTAKNTKQRQTLELIAHDSNGSEVWLFHTIIPIFKTNNDQLDYLTVVSADITEQKRIQEELKHREKMDAIGQLAGGVAHDFNNQLASILGYAEILKFKIQNNEEKKFLSKIIAAAERSGNLTKQMLAFSRKQNLQSETTNIHTEINETIDLLKCSLDKRISIYVDFQAASPFVRGDKSQLQSALLNLAINAADAMEDGGELRFKTSNVTSDNDSFLKSIRHTDGKTFLSLEVQDNGTGIEQDIKTKIFDPFYTTKLPGKGTGMGLASVYGTLKQHHGFIRVDSTVGMGTSFFLYLPSICNESEFESGPIAKKGQSNAAEQKTILVVDDEDSVRELCCDILDLSGYSTMEAKNGQAAVDIYQDHWQTIDAVILDLVMPVMSGSDALIEMRKINPNIKVLISSGYNRGQTLEDIKANSNTGLIEKPFRIESLLSGVEDLMLRVER